MASHQVPASATAAPPVAAAAPPAPLAAWGSQFLGFAPHASALGAAPVGPTVAPDMRVACQSQSAAAAAPAPAAASGPPPPPPTAAGPPPPSASFASSVPGWHHRLEDLEVSSGVSVGGRGGGDEEDGVDVLVESSGDEEFQ